MQVSLSEFLEKVSKLKKTQEKVEAIKANDSFPLRVIMQAAFDPKVEFLLPPGTPPYKPNDLVDLEHVLIREARMIQYFVKGFHDNLPQTKREQMFISLLENVDPKDALLLCAIKEKKLPYKGITIQHVLEGLPGLFQ
jgi:hypothetical protein